MSLTLKVTNLIDDLQLEKLFTEIDNKVYFNPVQFEISPNKIRNYVNALVSINGNAYEASQFELDLIKDLES